MPPINQGSRSVMVAWVVAMAIVGVVCTILSIYLYVDSNRVTQLMETQSKAYSDVMTTDMLHSDAVTDLDAARKDPNNQFAPNMRLFDVALAQRARLAKLISGSEDESKAVVTANNSIEKIKAAGIASAGDNLAAAIDALITDDTARKAEAANNKKDSSDSKTKLDQTVKSTQSQIESLTTTMQQLRAEKDAALAQVQEITTKQQTGFLSTADGFKAQLQAAQDQLGQVNSQNASLESQLAKLKTENNSLKERFNGIRVDPSKMIVRQADGHISRIAGNGVVFIDLGRGDHVTPGLTFEVYDKTEGIPPPGDPSTDENLPIGKASIEVVDVGPTGSKCRVSRQSGGTILAEGDLIANLVYDRNTKYNFVVHGNFDLDQNGVATAQDAEVIKQLITQWGGNVTSEINTETDFVVMGKEPAPPEKPQEQEALAERKYEEALAAYEAYGKILDQAKDLHLPILNQNRFLYLVGYFQQAKR